MDYYNWLIHPCAERHLDLIWVWEIMNKAARNIHGKGFM